MRTSKVNLKKRLWFILFIFASILSAASTGQAQSTVARQWNEALLDAIRIDFPAPTVHSRNLYHTSAAMYDAWATFDNTALGSFYTDKHTAGDIAAARDEAISYAAYRVLSQRYSLAVDPVTSQGYFDAVMSNLGYNTNVTTTVGDSPAAIGNRIAQTILSGTINDGSNEANNYVDNTGYSPTNAPMIVDLPSVTGQFGPALADPSRWQPLFIDSAFTQNGLVGTDLQEYVGPHWGNVETFALGKNGSPQPYSWSDIDPGAPPQFGSAAYRDNTVDLIRYSNSLDPNQGEGTQIINISPNTAGNRPLGTHNDQGYAVNPATGQPYADNFVKQADYGRVLAEFWADGPASETPPGHWNVLANEVSDHSLLEKRIGGTGPVVSDLEWDVKLYFTLNGAVHDAAVAAWGTKREYDYVRPITMIRYMGSLGQSSDINSASYHADGLPLETDLVELITAGSIADGGRHRNAYINANMVNGIFFPNFNITEANMVGRVAIQAWNHEPDDPETEVSGIDWILAENWVPYQSDNFVTPAFAAYVSGHSTFSRAAAEVMTLFTGDEYFPGGLGEMAFTTDFLEFELGPSDALTLQWATYYDAADEAGISRLYGGIHVPPDDFAGRIMGSTIGMEAFSYASQFIAVPEPDTTPPEVICSVDVANLWPPNHQLVDVGLIAIAVDDQDSDPTIEVLVLSDEDDDEQTGAGNHSPDATNDGATLRLRAERKGNGDGRVYLIVVTATDAAGNVGFDCCTVVVSHDRSRRSRKNVADQAALAESFCSEFGEAPPDFFLDLRLYGISGELTAVQLGDANGDGVLNNGDIASFVLALLNPVAYAAAFPEADPDVVLDMNHDGVCNNGDIAGFVATLIGP